MPSRFHLLARAALLLLPLGLPAARADAQGACATGTLAQYTAPGFSCRIGSWVFTEIGFAGDLTEIGGATGAVADPLSVVLTPFLHHDAAGRATFGFDLDGFETSMSVVESTSGELFGESRVGLGLRIASLDPRAALAGARLVGTQSVAGVPRAGDPTGTVESILGAIVAPIEPSPTTGDCFFTHQIVRAPGDELLDRSGTCGETPLPRWVGASVWGWTRVAGRQPATPLTASIFTSATRLELTEARVTATPEPATTALLGAGLLAVAVAARRRHRASA